MITKEDVIAHFYNQGIIAIKLKDDREVMDRVLDLLRENYQDKSYIKLFHDYTFTWLQHFRSISVTINVKPDNNLTPYGTCNFNISFHWGDWIIYNHKTYKTEIISNLEFIQLYFNELFT